MARTASTEIETSATSAVRDACCSKVSSLHIALHLSAASIKIQYVAVAKTSEKSLSNALYKIKLQGQKAV